jgi:hypothetical protein
MLQLVSTIARRQEHQCVSFCHFEKKKKKKKKIIFRCFAPTAAAIRRTYPLFDDAAPASPVAAAAGVSLKTILPHRSSRPAPKKFTATNLSTLFFEKEKVKYK